MFNFSKAKRVKQILDCTIIEGDSIEIMKDWVPEPWRADLILSDVPYLLTSGGKSGLMRGIFDPDEYSNDGSMVACDIEFDDFMPLFYDLLRDPGQAYVMVNNRNVQGILNAAEKAKFHFHNLLVWDKKTATANRWYMKNLEFTAFLSKGNAFQINDCSAKQLIQCPQIDQSHAYDVTGKGHPTEKPVPLMEHYITNSTKPGECVFDPFAGSFSTAVACVKSGRQFVGIDNDPRYFDIGVKRVEEAYRNYQQALF